MICFPLRKLVQVVLLRQQKSFRHLVRQRQCSDRYSHRHFTDQRLQELAIEKGSYLSQPIRSEDSCSYSGRMGSEHRRNACMARSPRTPSWSLTPGLAFSLLPAPHRWQILPMCASPTARRHSWDCWNASIRRSRPKKSTTKLYENPGEGAHIAGKSSENTITKSARTGRSSRKVAAMC
jgi:hypothetical protein